MPFEEFRRGSKLPDTHPVVTLLRHGKALTLNIPAYEALGRPKAIKLLYDRERRAIGVRAATVGETGVYRPHDYSRGRGYAVRAEGFTRHYEIPTDEARHWTAKMEGDVLVVEIDGPSLDPASGEPSPDRTARRVPARRGHSAGSREARNLG